ncbi:uncharacterized protein [Drosophila virilis]|uniref:uncharacterized protein isoform X3 n=1 Tax=Drosophila virilis TaxID=7244 RepID=UPI0038B38FA2
MVHSLIELSVFQYINSEKMASTGSAAGNLGINVKAQLTAISEEHRRIWIGNLDARITDLTCYFIRAVQWSASRVDMPLSHLHKMRAPLTQLSNWTELVWAIVV